MFMQNAPMQCELKLTISQAIKTGGKDNIIVQFYVNMKLNNQAKKVESHVMSLSKHFNEKIT